jgi:AcrR family transcriptional regulator
VGRRRRHNEAARIALLQAAEQLVAEGGLDAVGVRAAAARAATTTRAVYTVFGSRDDLVQGLAGRAFELLLEQLATVRLGDDPVENLVEAAIKGFRQFALDHRQLFRLFFIGNAPAWRLSDSSEATRQESLGQLEALIAAAQQTGWGRGYSIGELSLIWDAACCGLALREVCGGMDPARAERIWRDALGALASGLGRDRQTRFATQSHRV